MGRRDYERQLGPDKNATSISHRSRPVWWLAYVANSPSLSSPPPPSLIIPVFPSRSSRKKNCIVHAAN